MNYLEVCRRAATDGEVDARHALQGICAVMSRERPTFTIEYPCDALVVEPGRRAVVRYVTDRDRHLEGTDLVLRAGTVTIGHFWSDRPYNVYHWLEGGRTIAFYVSIATDTTIGREAIAYTDLFFDVLLRPSGAIDVLDE